MSSPTAFLSPVPLQFPSLSQRKATVPSCVAARPRPPATATNGPPAGGRRGNGGRGSRAGNPGRPGRAKPRTPAETPAARQSRLLETARREREEAAKSRNRDRRNARPLGQVIVGECVTGTVRNLVRHGVYVDIGAVKDGLVHIRDMSVEFVYDPSDYVRPKQEVRVWVKYVDAVKGVLGLTMVPPAGNFGFSGRMKVSDISIGSRVEGVVARVTNYGAYIDIGAERHGFVHVSALWGRRPRETLETLRLGRDIWVHVAEVDEVKSFIRLRARGRVEEQPLEEAGAVGEDCTELLDFGEGAEVGASETPPIRMDEVLQRHGEELGDENDDDEEDGEEDEESDNEDDDEGVDGEDEYEMDFSDEPQSVFQAPQESYQGYEDIDDILGNEEDSAGALESSIDEEWSEPTGFSFGDI